LNCYKLKFS